MRKRIADEMRLKSWDDVDLTLKEIAECTNTISGIEADMNKQLDDVKLASQMKAQEYHDRISELERDLKAFVEMSRGEIQGKTKILNFGRTGFRFSTKVVIKKVETVLANLKAMDMKDCIIIKESIDKDALKKYPDDKIYGCGASLKKDDTFWYEIDREKLQSQS